MAVITLAGSRGYQDIGTVGQTVHQLAGNIQSINQILDVGLRNTRDYQNGWIRVSDMIGLGIVKLINTDQLQYIPPAGTTLTASDSIVATAGNLTLVNDNADPGDNKFYGTNASGTLGWYSVSEGAIYTGIDSIDVSGTQISLVNDSADPGSDMLYGTNASGTLGWYAQPTGATGANPTGAVGFTAVNGSATTFLRSDGAPALNSSIYSSLNTASTLVYRDANGNTHANNFESAFATAAATGTITLTFASPRITSLVSGTGSAIVVLPDATTLHIGHTFEIDNNASGSSTIQLSGTGTTYLTVPTGSYLVLQCTSTSFAAGQWNYYWVLPATANWGTAEITTIATTVSLAASALQTAGSAYLVVTGTAIDMSATAKTDLGLAATALQTAGSAYLVVTGTAIDMSATAKTDLGLAATALQTAGSTYLVVTSTAIDLSAAAKTDLGLAVTAVQPGAIQNMESAGWNSSSGAVQVSLTVPQDILIPFACTLQEVDVLTQGPVGSCTVTILRGAASSGTFTFPPATDITNGNNVVCAAASKQILSATLASQGWTTSFGQNDILRLTLTANTNFTSVKVILRMY